MLVIQGQMQIKDPELMARFVDEQIAVEAAKMMYEKFPYSDKSLTAVYEVWKGKKKVYRAG